MSLPVYTIETFVTDGVVTQFDFGFKIDDATHIKVWKRTVSNGVTVELTPSEYVLTGVGEEDGGSVTISPALATGYEIVIESNYPYTQEQNLTNQGGFFPGVVETGMDRLARQVQQLQAEVNRAVRGTPGEAFTDLVGRGGRLNKYLGFDDAGHLRLIENAIIGGGVPRFQAFSSIEALRFNTTAYDVALVRSYFGDSGKGTGVYWYDPTSSNPDDGYKSIVDAAGHVYKLLALPAGNSSYNAGTVGDGVEVETEQLQTLFSDDRNIINLKRGEYLVDDNITFAHKASPRIIGQGLDSWLKRKPGYGNPADSGTAGGGYYPLLNMEDGQVGNDYIRNALFKDFAIGPDDPDYDVLTVGGHIIDLRAVDTTFDGLWGLYSKGNFQRGRYKNCRFRNINNLYANPAGGTAQRLEGSSDCVMEDNYLTSADDCSYAVVKAGNVDLVDPTLKMFGNMMWRNCSHYAKQGSSYSILIGDKDANSVTSITTQAKTVSAGTAQIKLKMPDNSISVGMTVNVTGAIGGDGFTAGQVNGVRTIIAIDPTDPNFVYFNGDNVATAGNITVGNNTKAQVIRVGFTNGSPDVTLFIPAHGRTVGDYVKIGGWATAGITNTDINGRRQITAVSVDGNELTVQAGANASGTAALASTYADADMTVALLMEAGGDKYSFIGMRGCGGDGAINLGEIKGGVARKLSQTESIYDCHVTIVDSDVFSVDTVDRPHTRLLGWGAGMIVTAHKDIMRSPRGPCFIMAADLRGKQAVHVNTSYTGQEVYCEAPANANTPTFICDGGTLIIFGGTLKGSATASILKACEDYSLASYFDDPRVFDPETGGDGGAPAKMKKIICMFVNFEDIADGCYGAELGAIESGLFAWCKFKKRAGATTSGGVKLRTAGVDIGTTNVKFFQNDFSEVDTAYTNWVPGQGNSRDDVVEIPSFTTGRDFPTYADGYADALAGAGADVMIALPWQAPNDYTLAGFGINATVAGSGDSAVKMAIYNAKAGKPFGAPIAKDETGTAANTTGRIANTDTMSASVKKGQWYFVITNLTGGTMPTVRGPDRARAMKNMAYLGGTVGGNPVTALKRAKTYANAWPTFDGTESWNDSTDNGNPIVYVRT